MACRASARLSVNEVNRLILCGRFAGMQVHENISTASWHAICFLYSAKKKTNNKMTREDQLTFSSEDRSRDAQRGHRLLHMAALGFIILALCLMAEDIRRLLITG